jgi:hypothetical protein
MQITPYNLKHTRKCNIHYQETTHEIDQTSVRYNLMLQPQVLKRIKVPRGQIPHYFNSKHSKDKMLEGKSSSPSGTTNIYAKDALEE